MKLRTLSRLFGVLIFAEFCILCIPGVDQYLQDYWNSKGMWGSIFFLLFRLFSFSIALTAGFMIPLIDKEQSRTKEQKREFWFTLSTSLNLALIPTFIAGLSWYGSFHHDPMHHNMLVGLIWLIIPFTASINMMRSKSTRHFQGLRLVQSS